MAPWGGEVRDGGLRPGGAGAGAGGRGASATFQFEGRSAGAGPAAARDAGATRARELDTATDRDGRALREKVLAQGAGGQGPAGEGLYKGQTGYTDFRSGFRREHTVAGDKAFHGPLRASSAVRWSVRVDYQPDVCKDFKETGYCGWGDACKFLHDRGDYKAGWQLDKEWEEKERLRRRAEEKKAAGGGESESEGAEEDDGLPFACLICRKAFQDPVVTLCGHYFCERCVLRHKQARLGLCPACQKPTKGIFNVAKAIIRKQRKAAEEAALRLPLLGGPRQCGPAVGGGAEFFWEAGELPPPLPDLVHGEALEEATEAELEGIELPPDPPTALP